MSIANDFINDAVANGVVERQNIEFYHDNDINEDVVTFAMLDNKQQPYINNIFIQFDENNNPVSISLSSVKDTINYNELEILRYVNELNLSYDMFSFAWIKEDNRIYANIVSFEPSVESIYLLIGLVDGVLGKIFATIPSARR